MFTNIASMSALCVLLAFSGWNGPQDPENYGRINDETGGHYSAYIYSDDWYFDAYGHTGDTTDIGIVSHCLWVAKEAFYVMPVIAPILLAIGIVLVQINVWKRMDSDKELSKDYQHEEKEQFNAMEDLKKRSEYLEWHSQTLGREIKDRELDVDEVAREVEHKCRREEAHERRLKAYCLDNTIFLDDACYVDPGLAEFLYKLYDD